MKKSSLIGLLMIVMLALAGCGSSDNENNNETNANASMNDNGNNSSDDVESNENGDHQILQLGETGTIKDTTGEYEVTPTSFQVVKEWEGEVPNNDDLTFLVVDVTIKNIGESVLNGEELRKVDAIGGKDLTFSNNQLIDKINELEGELQPGEKMVGQLAFALVPTDTYQLVFGLHLGSVSNQITWELPADQAK